MKDNVHLQAIPPDVLKQALDKFAEIKALLQPYLLTLTPEERREMLKMGDKSFSFVEQAYDYAVQNPEFLPAFLKLSDFTADFRDAHDLLTIRNVARQLFEGIDDTAMAAGSEAFQKALIFYHAVKAAAVQAIAGAKAIYEALKSRFPGASGSALPKNPASAVRLKPRTPPLPVPASRVGGLKPSFRGSMPSLGRYQSKLRGSKSNLGRY